jgi:hypothetical protein
MKEFSFKIEHHSKTIEPTYKWWFETQILFVVNNKYWFINGGKSLSFSKIFEWCSNGNENYRFDDFPIHFNDSNGKDTQMKWYLIKIWENNLPSIIIQLFVFCFPGQNEILKLFYYFLSYNLFVNELKPNQIWIGMTRIQAICEFLEI